MSNAGKQTNPLEAIRQNCVECCFGSEHDVASCGCIECSLYPFRHGRNPYRKKRSENAGSATGESCKEVKDMLNEKSTIKELEEQARNTKLYIDRVVQAATGMTLEEIHRAALQRETERKDTTANGAER